VRRAAAAALVAAVLLAGCGGGSDEPKVVSKDLYITKGDAVCASLTARFEAAGSSDPNTPKEIVEAADVLAGLYGDLLGKLEDLQLPTRPADHIGAEAYVAAIRRTNALLADLQSSAKSFEDAVDRRDQRRVAATGNGVRKALDAFRAAQAGANQRAIAYGFNLCGNLS
jgi:hypothetical protein